MEVTVLSLGGSVLVKDEDPSAYLSELAQMLVEVSSHTKLYIVAGGGRIARFYIRAGQEPRGDRAVPGPHGHRCDEAQREAPDRRAQGTRVSGAPEGVRGGRSRRCRYPIVVMGGVTPGVTTDAVSARLAERVGATRLVNATSVDGAYTADPKKDVCAKRIPRMSHAELVKTGELGRLRAQDRRRCSTRSVQRCSCARTYRSR